MISSKRAEGRTRRKMRIRKKVVGTALRPRLSIFRSLKHMSAQMIDDTSGKTLVAASTMEKDLRTMKGRGAMAGAARIGELIAERAKAKGIEDVVFDRNGYRYHGCVKAIAAAAREKGLKF